METSIFPGQSISSAISALRPGDVLTLSPGQYVEDVVVTGLIGTRSAPITIRGKPGAIVRASGAVNVDAFLVRSGSCFIIFDGLEITGANRAGILCSGSSAHNITIRNCHIHDNAKWQIQSTGVNYMTVENCKLHGSTDQHGIYFSSSSYCIASHNEIYSNKCNGIHLNGGYGYGEGGDGIVHGPTIVGNIIYNNGAGGGSAVNMDGVDDGLIANNLIVNNKAGGITNFKVDGLHCGQRNKIFNNTVYFPQGDGRYSLQLGRGSTDNVVKNNLFVCGGTVLEVQDAALNGNTFDHNVYYRINQWGAAPILYGGGGYTVSRWQSATGQDAASSGAMPTFANISQQNFRLATASVGVDDGANLPEVAEDVAGTPRPQGAACDIGAYELAAAQIEPPTPPPVPPPAPAQQLWVTYDSRPGIMLAVSLWVGNQPRLRNDGLWVRGVAPCAQWGQTSAANAKLACAPAIDNLKPGEIVPVNLVVD